MEIGICESIKKLRKKYNISQEVLADSLGITVQAISKWENGKAYPNIILLPKIADYFHVSIDILFQGGMEDANEVLPDKTYELLDLNGNSWDCIGDSEWCGTSLPDYGPFTVGEESLNLFGDLENKTVLEIACGDGRSLLYNAQRGARELWGLDISPRQIDKAKTLLRENRVKAQLLVSPMEINPGIPFHYFDCVYSIYGLGWTMDLSKTIGLISRYLKTNGVFIFSWDNPPVHIRTGNPHAEGRPAAVHQKLEAVLLYQLPVKARFQGGKTDRTVQCPAGGRRARCPAGKPEGCGPAGKILFPRQSRLY